MANKRTRQRQLRRLAERRAAERRRQRRRIARGGDQVDVLDGVGPAARAARDLDPLGRRLLAQRVPQRLGDLERLRQEQLRLLATVLASGERQQDALLRLGTEPADRA
jgi:hypothetical protein